MNTVYQEVVRGVNGAHEVKAVVRGAPAKKAGNKWKIGVGQCISRGLMNKANKLIAQFFVECIFAIATLVFWWYPHCVLGRV